MPKGENKTHKGMEAKPGVREPRIKKGHVWAFNSRWQAASIGHDWFTVEQRWGNRGGAQKPAKTANKHPQNHQNVPQRARRREMPASVSAELLQCNAHVTSRRGLEGNAESQTTGTRATHVHSHERCRDRS